MELLSPPLGGRTHRATRRVRHGDIAPSGRLRLDTIARYLQDVAHDDVDDAGADPRTGWVVRRTAIQVHRSPTIGEPLDVVTWCSGFGTRWAGRRTSITTRGGDGRIETTAVWIHVDVATGRPAPLLDEFFDIWGDAAAGRAVSSRLELPDPDAAPERTPWVQRATDHDRFGHMNNARMWEAVEDALLTSAQPFAPSLAVMEHRRPVAPGEVVERVVVERDGALAVWLLADGAVAAAADVSR